MGEKKTALRGQDRDIIGRYADVKLNDQMQSLTMNGVELPLGIPKESFGKVLPKAIKPRKKKLI